MGHRTNQQGDIVRCGKLLHHRVAGRNRTARAHLEVPIDAIVGRRGVAVELPGNHHTIKTAPLHQSERIDLEVHIGVGRGQRGPIVAAGVGAADRRKGEAAERGVHECDRGRNHPIEHPSQHELTRHGPAVFQPDPPIERLPLALADESLGGGQLRDPREHEDARGEQQHSEDQHRRRITLGLEFHKDGKAGSTKKSDVRPAMLL